MQACFFGGSMDCRFGFMIAIVTALFAAAPANAQTGGGASGIWLTQAGDAKKRVSQCGGGNFGVVVSPREPIHATHPQPPVHDQNTKPAPAKPAKIGPPPV